MSEEWNVFPDSERLATDILVAAVSGGDYDSLSLVNDLDVGVVLPPNPTYPAIVVARIGGIPRERHRLDHPNLQFDVWGNTKAEAHDVAQVSRRALHAAEGQVWRDETTHVAYAVLTGVEDALGLSWQFDTVSNQPRYTFAVYFTVHVP